MSHVLHFAVLLVGCVAAVRPLARARWVARMPRTALLLWQALGVTFELSLFGLLFSAAFAPENQGLLPGLLRLAADPANVPLGPAGPLALGVGAACVGGRIAALSLAWLAAGRHRRRHRHLLALVARSDDALPGVAILDHPAPAAYCLPGRHGSIVLSTGALHALERQHLAAVIAHERAHLRQRHDLVLLPLLAWRRLIPHSAPLDEAVAAVRLLLEMCADDACCRRLPARDLTRALTRFENAGPPLATPAGGFGAADTALRTRRARLLAPAPPGATAAGRLTVLALAAGLLSTPLSLFLLPV
ncbi:M56 family metallopeptidase [Streptomyces sp. 6N223]|uniref:M56 family metallopeptidase n=1 Tax=Streptomyces sp. 6N223 TaxID=3457412 RepID=UPI003FD3B3BE